MRRTVIAALLFAGLGLLPWGWTAGPPASKPGAAEVRAVAPPAKATLAPAEQLARVVDFKGFDDPKTTLGDALKRLEKDYGLRLEVDERAFKFDMLNEVLKTPVADPNPVPPMKAKLGAVLQKVLDRVPVPSGATYLLRGDRIEVTTGEFMRYEVLVKGYRAPIAGEVGGGGGDLTEGYRGPQFPLVNLTFDRRPLDQALRDLSDQADYNIVLDASVGKRASTPITLRLRNTPLDTAVLLLADMVDLRPVRTDNVFYLTTPDKAKALAQAHKEHRPTWTLEEAVRKEVQALLDELDVEWVGFKPAGFGPPPRPRIKEAYPPVTASFIKSPLREALAVLAGSAERTVVLDPRVGRQGMTPVTAMLTKAPLDSAVRLVADIAGLKVILVDGALYVTTPANAAKLEKDEERWRKAKAAAAKLRPPPAKPAKP